MFIEPFNFSFFSITGWGIDLDYCDIEWFPLEIEKVGKTTRPFKYELNQIPYDYTVEVTNRFNALDLIEYLMNYGWRSLVGCSPRGH